MKSFPSLLDWSTQATQAMHGMLFSRGGKQEFPLHLQVASLRAKSGSAACVCQWTNLVEIRKATPKATFIFLVVLETLMDQSRIFLGTFFSTRKFNVNSIEFQQNLLIFLIVHFLNFSPYFIAFCRRSTRLVAT